MKKQKVWLEEIPPKRRYIFFGFFFGLLFPVVGIMIEYFFGVEAAPSQNTFEVIMRNPVLLIVSTAPIVLAILFGAIGTREEKLAKINETLEAKIIERTSALEKSNQALETENLERKHAEKESNRQKKYFQALIENSPTAVVLLDNEQKITHCNAAFEDLYGYNCAEITGSDIDKLISTEETKKEA